MNANVIGHGDDLTGARPDLRVVREGTEYFLQKLRELNDDRFDGPSLLPGWTRRHVAAHVAYNAVALLNLVEWAETGVEKPMYESPAARDAEIEQGVALAPAALRELNNQAATKLDTAWNALTDEAWQAEVRTRTGQPVAASATVWMRTREVWLHAVDLNTGASFTDIPADCIDHVAANVIAAWRARQAAEQVPNFVLRPDDRPGTWAVGSADAGDAVILTGSAAALTQWATGRGAAGVATESGAEAPMPPAWL